MKTILGLDLGTNSIGWAKVSLDDNGNYLHDIKLGCRIIPMSQDVLDNFGKGVTVSQTSVRTGFRGVRRIRERSLQRRERLHRVLHRLGFLPQHYDAAIGWDSDCAKTYGKFLDNGEPKLAWERQEDGSMRFLFMNSFYEMIADFTSHQPALVADGKKIPLDWTLYYLRKKALTQAIRKEELAWILLSFNQKRGYYQLRGEEEDENPTKREEFCELKVVAVEAAEKGKGDDIWYNVHLENGCIYRRSSKISLDDWVGKTKQFIITTEYEKDGVTPKKDKDGKEKRSYRAPKEDDWGLRKKRTETDLEASGKTVGAFIYEHLLAEPFDKIRGNFIHTIERKYYRAELEAILTEQRKYHEELRSEQMLAVCAEELYRSNLPHQQSLLKKDMVYLLLSDLIFYQRPLKSKKSLIADCPYEYYRYVDKETGEIKKQGIKCIAKSNPYYQEFRLWQFVLNLRLFDRMTDKEVTADYLPTKEDYVRLFDYLNNRKEINQETLLKDFFRLKKVKLGREKEFEIRWNYIEDKEKKYPCNETRYELLVALDRAGIDRSWIDEDGRQYRLWHLLYSIEVKAEAESALRKLNSDDAFVSSFLKVKPFKKDYGAYSEKAVKKLLAVMRMGSMWSEANICEETQNRIRSIIRGDIEEKIKERMGHTARSFNQIDDFQALPEWLACYVVYGRHSEVTDIQHWETPEQLQSYINGFKQHSLRNPIVEQCILETLRTVHDIWKEAGHIDEIHVELGRDMKRTADQRARMTKNILKNENTNLRIKSLLMELKKDTDIKEVRPYSPMQQEILRIYEEGALLQLKRDDEAFADISKISQMAQPTATELRRYKLWLDQKYRSPYTGKFISLSKLFTSAYQIEHVIPQSRYFDDSFSNKVICEAEVNRLKSNMLGYEFIKAHGGEIVHCTMLGDVKILSESEYKAFVNEHYVNHRAKKEKLLMEDIPQEFLNRQMNDSRYISKVVKALLSNIVRTEDEMDVTSKFVVPCSGGITDRLKKDWGLNDVWNSIVYPRFERLNRMTGTEAFGHWENKEGKRVFQTSVPIELQLGFSKKRIDHRHHAMDALVIACASRNIINYLNNESANSQKKREDLRRLLCDKNRIIRKPWESFTQDARVALQDIVVSFKNYVRIINKATNYYERYDEQGKKTTAEQKSSEMWAIRKPMHKETVFGHVNLKRKTTVKLKNAIENIPNICNKELKAYINELVEKHFNTKQMLAHFKSINYRWNRQNVEKVEVWQYSDEKERMAATRKPLDTSFDKKRIETITDTGIQKILLNYLEEKGGDPNIAFTPEGIAEMNKNISLFNDGKLHQPILKVRVAKTMGAKYQVGQTGNKAAKYVGAQEGTNLYFAIYENEEGERSYNAVPLNEVAERLKQGMSPVPEKNEKDVPLKFYLSPNDLVYVPTEEDKLSNECKLDNERIYKMVSATGKKCHFLPYSVANIIYNKVEFESMNKMGKALSGEMIKAVCWKLEVDRLGTILRVIK
ncbi:type II CRISPR RNA-guided endonuclease Cas9 [Prevotella corporis]|uniref:CRISPR-associated endonuclease Cas9 n=1 Tax=Prevotella corporis TaxID=28128 RepID=A0A133Q212_9BACT|nr:type II CRISPR RNA-guided endonuclease Cas9 [Prevotella corporis]KXA36902.1 CRISPR-associated protein, Csn1 family [Prevotella corporis]